MQLPACIWCRQTRRVASCRAFAIGLQHNRKFSRLVASCDNAGPAPRQSAPLSDRAIHRLRSACSQQQHRQRQAGTIWERLTSQRSTMASRRSATARVAPVGACRLRRHVPHALSMHETTTLHAGNLRHVAACSISLAAESPASRRRYLAAAHACAECTHVLLCLPQARVKAISEVVEQLVRGTKAGQVVNVDALKKEAATKYGLARAPKLVEIISAVPDDFRDTLLPKCALL